MANVASSKGTLFPRNAHRDGHVPVHWAKTAMSIAPLEVNATPTSSPYARDVPSYSVVNEFTSATGPAGEGATVASCDLHGLKLVCIACKLAKCEISFACFQFAISRLAGLTEHQEFSINHYKQLHILLKLIMEACWHVA